MLISLPFWHFYSAAKILFCFWYIMETANASWPKANEKYQLLCHITRPEASKVFEIQDLESQAQGAFFHLLSWVTISIIVWMNHSTVCYTIAHKGLWVSSFVEQQTGEKHQTFFRKATNLQQPTNLSNEASSDHCMKITTQKESWSQTLILYCRKQMASESWHWGYFYIAAMMQVQLTKTTSESEVMQSSVQALGCGRDPW